MSRIRFWPWLTAMICLLVSASERVYGCASCFGASDSSMAKGMNAGIFVLLGFVLVFWLAFGSFFVFIIKRSRQSKEVLPGDQCDPQHN
jgi:Ni,Fe-hydrogenase I cytochrome b subunit